MFDSLSGWRCVGLLKHSGGGDGGSHSDTVDCYSRSERGIVYTGVSRLLGQTNVLNNTLNICSEWYY